MKSTSVSLEIRFVALYGTMCETNEREREGRRERGERLVFVSLQVAARVKTEEGDEQWILAEVFSYNSHNHRYCVDDIDEEGHCEQRY